MADRASLRAQGLALALGAFCGQIAYLLGLPLPWMLGPMLGVTIAALVGVPIRSPERLRPFVIPVIGVLLGSSITMQVLSAALGWWPSVLILIPFLSCAAAISFTFYRKVAGFDPVTAYFCAMPGGLNDMLILGGAAGGDEKRIALAHAARVLIVVSFVVLFYGLVLGVTSASKGGAWVRMDALVWSDWAILAGCAVAGVPLAKAMRLPAPEILGPMILSGAAHVTSIVTVAPPSVLVIVAQVVVGTVIGSRFIGATLREVGRDISFATLSTGAMIAVAVLFALALTEATGIPLSQSFLAYSPGGLTEMSLLALTMGQDVTFVSTLHIVRIVLVIAVAAPVFRMLRLR